MAREFEGVRLKNRSNRLLIEMILRKLWRKFKRVLDCLLKQLRNLEKSSNWGSSLFCAGVAELEQAANLKFVGVIACGFESRLRYHRGLDHIYHQLEMMIIWSKLQSTRLVNKKSIKRRRISQILAVHKLVALHLGL